MSEEATVDLAEIWSNTSKWKVIINLRGAAKWLPRDSWQRIWVLRAADILGRTPPQTIFPKNEDYVPYEQTAKEALKSRSLDRCLRDMQELMNNMSSNFDRINAMSDSDAEEELDGGGQ